MIKIAIVDDDPKICAKIENVLIAYNNLVKKEFDIEVLYSGEELYAFISFEQNFDLVFLDIQMKSLDGIELGRLIRNKFKNNIMQIVYITSLETRDRELFSVRPMGFIPKPISDSDIVREIDKYLDLFENMDKSFEFTYERTHIKIDYDKILFFKSNDKLVELHTKDETYLFYGKLSEIITNLPFQFITIHKSYIINKFYIAKYNYANIIMVDDNIIPISTKNRKSVRKLLLHANINAGEEFFYEC